MENLNHDDEAIRREAYESLNEMAENSPHEIEPRIPELLNYIRISTEEMVSMNIAMAIWTVAEIGLMAWKYKKEKEKAVREQRIQEDLHERQQQKIQDELAEFNKGMQQSTSFMKITNEELRGAMRKTILGGSESSALNRLAAATEETIKLQQQILDASEDTASNTTRPMLGAED